MPIRFRCAYCNRLLGIATRKAGMETTCPHCGYTITVPIPHEVEERTERMDFEDVEAMLGNAATEVAQPAAVVAPPVPLSPPPAEQPRVEPPPVPHAPAAKPVPPPKPISTNPNERPLFEADMDELLGKTKVPVEPERAKPPAVSGKDALSLGETSHQIVISSQKATYLMVLVVVLVVTAFAAGYFVAPR